MKYFNILFIISILLIISCHKYATIRSDIGTTNTGLIGGRLALSDNLTGNYDTLPLKNKLVTLSYGGAVSGSNYLFSKTTDSNGYFLFTDLRTDDSYTLSFTDTGANQIVYQATQTLLRAGNDSLLFLASPVFSDNNGFEYYFTDTTTQPGPIPGVSVSVFTSSVLVSDTTSLGSAYQLTSDKYGRAYQFHLKPGTYYAVIKTSFPTLKITKHDTLQIKDTGLVIHPIPL
jgi:hypothetical protein